MKPLPFIEGETREFEREVALEMQNPIRHFEKELTAIRTGRASARLVEDIMVECYGSMMRIRDLATITVPDARLITIQPWDKNVIADVEKALLASDLGITPANDGVIIRLQLPQMSIERRDEMVKILGKKTEECRVGVRNIRKEAQNQLKTAQKESVISEDFAKRLSESLQKVTDNTIKVAEELSEKKTSELRSI